MVVSNRSMTIVSELWLLYKGRSFHISHSNDVSVGYGGGHHWASGGGGGYSIVSKRTHKGSQVLLVAAGGGGGMYVWGISMYDKF